MARQCRRRTTAFESTYLQDENIIERVGRRAGTRMRYIVSYLVCLSTHSSAIYIAGAEVKRTEPTRFRLICMFITFSLLLRPISQHIRHNNAIITAAVARQYHPRLMIHALACSQDRIKAQQRLLLVNSFQSTQSQRHGLLQAIPAPMHMQ